MMHALELAANHLVGGGDAVGLSVVAGGRMRADAIVCGVGGGVDDGGSGDRDNDGGDEFI